MKLCREKNIVSDKYILVVKVAKEMHQFDVRDFACICTRETLTPDIWEHKNASMKFYVIDNSIKCLTAICVSYKGMNQPPTYVSA